MTITETTELAPGVLFEARDGNHNMLEDARWPAPDEPTDYVLDAEGNEIRTGDFVLVLQCNWTEYVGKVVRVTDVSRAELYSDSRIGGYVMRDGEDGTRIKAWSPSSTINSIHFTFQNSQTGTSPLNVRKVNLTKDDTLRCELSEMYEDRSRLDRHAAEIEAKRTTLNIRIREHRQELGEI